ncbi:YfhE family protein [Ureibacillus sp. FSL K6-8385]|uniref:YfhE family protein n=1 Tax=Ureibacillus terrenus TaxID=118246 RepID=A0A540V6A6_9BACL|nr:YfhE family protein [Ureibacillus terrenus]MED3660767.1 YfhE family protein [Ureibacillus terrenus]MED3762955.1 YfhE family protein [Ureibacillus terrenus]TQE92245.1 YfhE family protein [Ureibacillus terrenus]
MKKPVHERLAEKNNGLTKAQEVLYKKDFKQAKETAKNIENGK